LSNSWEPIEEGRKDANGGAEEKLGREKRMEGKDRETAVEVLRGKGVEMGMSGK